MAKHIKWADVRIDMCKKNMAHAKFPIEQNTPISFLIFSINKKIHK